jgi:hypothetical protein
MVLGSVVSACGGERVRRTTIWIETESVLQLFCDDGFAQKIWLNSHAFIPIHAKKKGMFEFSSKCVHVQFVLGAGREVHWGRKQDTQRNTGSSRAFETDTGTGRTNNYPENTTTEKRRHHDRSATL